MTANRFDRAATALGAAAMASAVFVFTNGDPWEITRVRGAAIAIVLVFGALAVLAGRLGRRALMLAAGAGFLTASALQLFQAGRETNWLAGNGSTVSLFLGFGIGLLAVGLARRD